MGGMLLGLSAVLLLVINGRIAGISGIVGRLIGGQQISTNLAFLIGLISGPLAFRLAYGGFPAITTTAAWWVIVAAGVLVGFGTRMGSGCTSGHGILGLSRFSKRSIAATLTFMSAGIIAATLPELFK
jgi:uncharacterized membrane protein YedE/YeeE